MLIIYIYGYHLGCVNINDNDCTNWAADGECTVNLWMITNCRLACGACPGLGTFLCFSLFIYFIVLYVWFLWIQLCAHSICSQDSIYVHIARLHKALIHCTTFHSCSILCKSIWETWKESNVHVCVRAHAIIINGYHYFL